MPVLQTSFGETVAKGYPGMRPNGSPRDPITRTIESAAGIGFGKVAYRGAGDHGIVATQTLAAAGSAAAGNVGTSTITASPTAGLGAQIGRYVVTQLTTSATGALIVTAPDGSVVAHGNVGTAITTVPGITTFTVTNGGTATAGDQWYIDVSGNAALGITIANQTLGLVGAQTVDIYPQYENVEVETRGPVLVIAGGNVTDGASVQIDANGDFVASGGSPLTGWIFDTTGADDDLVTIKRR